MSDAERILICLHSPVNGIKLIERATRLAGPDAALHLLVHDARDDDHLHEQELDRQMYTELAASLPATTTFTTRAHGTLLEVVLAASHRFAPTQIVLGQQTENLWGYLLDGSLTDELLQRIPTADVHIVPAARSDESEHWPYEAGLRAHLEPIADGLHALRTGDRPTHLRAGTIHGMFFREQDTDFDNGIFYHHHEGHLTRVDIHRGTSTTGPR